MKAPQKPQIRRRKNGTFPKGTSGNPGGRPKEEKEIIEALRRRGDELVAALFRAALRKKPDVRAITEAFNRAYGKARQLVELSGKDGGPLEIDYSKLSVEQLEELRSILEDAAAPTTH
jgi:hypothetical protein